MTIEMQASAQTEQTTTTPVKDLGGLSFPEYEAARRGEVNAASETSESAPAKAAEQKESENSEASETEEVEAAESEEGVESEEQSEDESLSKDDAKEGAKDKPRKSGWQRRIEKLNKRASDAQQEAEYWKREAQKNATAPTTEPKEIDSRRHAPASGRPDPANFDTNDEYVEAMGLWTAKQVRDEERREAEKTRLKTEHDKTLQSHAERVKSFSEKTKDFWDVLEAVDDVQVSPTVQNELVSSENGPALLYELARNREEFERINRLNPLAAVRELGRIEERLAAKASAPKQEVKRTTNAPKPIEPVGTGSGSTIVKSIHDRNLTFPEYERIRREQMRRQGA